MALDVRLSRDVDEPWGFELFGGADEEMPLTIQKIEPDSPAKRAGLLNGDTILTINGEEAIDLSLEAACRKVDKCEHSLTIGVLRGLYDPVLDDQETLYDYEPESLGQQSEPTEVVFKIQQFLEPSDIGSNLLDYDINGTNIPLTESRSLTSSPFVTPTKPYRPFSTEPLIEVPPLEDPIILNPNYRDQFGKSPLDTDPDYILNAHCKNGLGIEGRYKLPISEQYDPDGTRFKQSTEVVEKLLKYEKTVKSLSKNLEVVDVTKETKICDTVVKDSKESLVTDGKTNGVTIKEDAIEKKDVKISEEVSKYESVRKDSKSTEKKEVFAEEIEEEAINEELKYIEKMRQEIDLAQIEETALSVVEDSIERAVSVTEEIKKEMKEELSSSEVECTAEKVSKSVKSEEFEEIKEYDDKKVSREEKFETEEEVSRKVVKKDVKESDISEKVSKKDGKVAVERKALISEEYEHEEIREEPRRKESAVNESFEGKFEKQGEFKKVTKTVISDTKIDKDAEHRAYSIGLQTIPNIRGVVHSSYHYDLLLRTFFIHLTDVMVALSRFVLTQPVFSQLETAVTTHTESGDLRMRKSSQEVTEKIERTSQEVKMQQERKEVVKPLPVKEVSQKIQKELKVESQEKKIEMKEIIKPVAVKQEVKIDKKDVKQEVKIEKVEAKKEQKLAVEVAEKKSGAQMAQRSEKKLSQEMTQKMDAVISEFQTIAVEEDVKKEMLQRSRRSRSRSQIEEEVMKESDPLDWLSKVDSRRTSQERTETVEKKSFVESKQEIKHKKSKTPKQMYVAIVESHVYTNKDAIFEEVTDISETSSVQNAEEIHTAIEAVETVSTENVALESAIRELETAKIVEESSHKVAKVTAESAATVQKIEEVMHESKEFVQEEFKKETAVQSHDIQEVLIQEMKEIIEPVVEIKQTKAEVEKVAINLNDTLSVAESTEVSIEESKSELKNAIQELETAKVVEESSHHLVKTFAESAATVQKIEEVMHESKDFVQEEFKKETAVQSRDIQEVLIQELKEIVEPVVEIKETKTDVEKVAIDINETLSVAQSTEVSIEEAKSEFKNIEVKEETVAIVEEKREFEKAIESKVEVLEPKPVEITETVKVKPGKKNIQEEHAALKIIKRVETEGNLSPEIIEVQDISELISKSVISKIGVGEQLAIGSSKQVSEQSFISSEIGMASKQEVDIQASQMSSQVAVSSMKKELQAESLTSESVVQESSFTAKSADRNLSLDLKRQSSVPSPPSTISTPTPSTVPPTPLTDEYVFKLSLPLPRSRSATPIPRDSTLSPEDEDPHIVKKKLIPYIETTIDRVIYDPPLPSPPADKVESPTYTKPVLNGGASNIRFPVYTKPGLKGGANFRKLVYRKPGLFGGADDPDYHKEEIREIERKSSLLASAIDETIKSIEEYKEEVGIDTKKEVKVQEFKEERVSKSYQESYTKEVRTESKLNGFEEIDTKIDEIMQQCEALASFDKVETDEKAPIIEEMDTKEVSIEETKAIESNINKAEEKTVKFDNEVKIIEVDSIADTIIETKVEEKSPEIVIEQKIKQETPAIDVAKEVVQKPDASEIRPKSAELSKTEKVEEKSDPLLGFRPVVFDPEGLQRRNNILPVYQESVGVQDPRQSPYISESGELIGTIQGIVDGLEEPVMDEEVAKALGKPGITEEKIATLISGEAEMLREAHVMGVDFQKIKPMINSLKDSEVLKALNEELERQKAEEKKKEEKKWTTFLQKPKRPVPKAKFGYHGWTEDEQVVTEPYKVKIVKQAKPKVAPDYKPEDFETGPLPWEERAVTESQLPPVEPEEPILIPEVPEFLEAVDPLKESEVPDLEDTGIPLPPPKEPTPPPIEEQPQEPQPEVQEVVEEVAQPEEEEKKDEGMDNRLAEQLVRSVQGMVDPNASVEQQLAQMRAQLAALAQLPEVIQQSLELVSKQLTKMTHQEAHMEMSASHVENQNYQQVEVVQNHTGSEMQTIEEVNESTEASQNEAEKMTIEEVQDTQVQQNMVKENAEMGQQNVMQQEMRRLATPVMTEEDIKSEKQKKEQARLDFESRQVKQHPTPRVAPTKAKKMFGPLDPDEARAVVLPGGRRWRNTKDVYDEQKIAETLQAHSELIQGKTMGFESDLLPYDNRINFMKYEKPPVSLDHLKHSEVYKLVHDMDQTPLKRVEMRTPVMCEADYRERCRSMTPSVEKKHLQIPQQFHP